MLMLLASSVFAEVQIISNYPFKGSNVEKVINRDNYPYLVEMLKALDVVKDVYVMETPEEVLVYVERYPIVRRIVTRGNRALGEDQIKAQAGIYEGMPWKDLTEDVLALRIKGIYTEEGFLDAKVGITWDMDEDGYVELYIGVDEEDVYFYKNSEYEGVSVNTEDLNRASALVRGRVAREEDFIEGLYKVEDYYINLGFLDAVVFLKDVRKEGYDKPYLRVLMPMREDAGKKPLTLIGALAEGINNLLRHPIGTLKALMGRGRFAVPVYSVREGELYSIMFEGADSFSHTDLLKATGLKQQGVDLFTLESAKENLLKLYRSKGFFDARVSYTWSQNVVVFQIEEGQRYTYKGRFFDEEEIKRVLDEEVERLKREGYTLATAHYSVIPDRNTKEVRVDVRVDKGKKPVLKRFVYSGDNGEIKGIFRRFNDRLPAVYNTKMVEDLGEALKDYFLKKGLMEAQSEVNVSVEEDADAVYYIYNYTITEGRRYRLGEDVYYGLGSTRPRELSYMIAKGEYYSKDLDDETLSNVLTTGIFSGLKIDTFIDHEKAQVHRLIQISEDKRGYLDLSLGYNTEENIALSALVGWKNLLGVGLNSSLSYKRSQKRELYNLELSDNFLFTRRLWLRSALFKSFENHRSYDLDSKGFSTSLGYRITRHTSVGPTLYATQNRVLGQEIFLRKVSVFLIREYKDDLFLPTRVHYDSVQLSFGMGDVSYSKLDIQTYYFIPLRKDFNFSFKLAGGYVSKSAPIFERFFLGGLKDLRGYTYEEVGQPSGGRYYTFGRAELEMPVRLPVVGVVFADVGKVGNSLKDTLRKPKWSFGGGLGVKTPIGPLRLDVAFPSEKDFYKKPKIYLSVGYIY